MKRSFGLNLKGRVKNFSLPTNKPLMPLFEAVVNSFHAITEKNIDNGIIEIKVIRNASLLNDGLDSITSFEIFDNGIGFNNRNLDSFMESDSDYKFDIGGKGVGRFTWLKAFENVHVKSIYQENNQYYLREFDFNQNIKDIDDSPKSTAENDTYTKITLDNYNSKYGLNVYKKLDTIARKLIFHCLLYFLSDKCPKVFIYDDNEKININDLCNSKIITEDSIVKFNIEEKEFSLMHVKVDSDMADEHALNLCGNDRFVQSKTLSKYIVNLCDQIKDKEYSFWYLGILRSQYLDENVDMNRLAFTTIPENRPDNQIMPIVSIENIVNVASEKVYEYLKDYLNPIEKTKVKRIDDYITHIAPEYRHLKKYATDKLSELKPNLSDGKLDEELYKIKKTLDYENRKEIESLKNSLCFEEITVDEYEKQVSSLIPKITSANQAILAEYVTHRKIILDLFDYGLRMKDNGKYEKEAFMHNLIYPMRKNSDNIKLEDHNLWLIDERLAYYLYAASDIFLGDSNKDKNNKTRPDVLLFDQIYNFFENEDSSRPKDSVVLIEFKRPMRDNFINEDPVAQLLDYQTELETNKKKDAYGRYIRVDKSTKFYLYAICDLSETYKNKLRRVYNMHDDVDGAGFYRFDGNTSISVLSFDKVKEDARKRNKILFDKLGI